MPNNILTSILNIVDFENRDLSSYSTTYEIRINSVGEQLEYYLKDSIADSFHIKGDDEKHKVHGKICSWLGNQNNPPDIIIKGGDAYEIKKTGGLSGSIQLNSAHPKSMLHRDDSRLTSAARECEEGWSEKDIYYVIGQVQNQQIKHLFYVQGKCYAADREVYKRIENIVTQATLNADLEFKETNELGRVSRVDPLGITDLRIRGMWIIQHPNRVFRYLYTPVRDRFGLVALLLREKYNSFPQIDREIIENHDKLFIQDVTIRSPNNPAEQLDAVLIVYPKISQTTFGS